MYGFNLPNALEGVARLFDWANALDDDVALAPDALAIALDWATIGGDFSSVINLEGINDESDTDPE